MSIISKIAGKAFTIASAIKTAQFRKELLSSLHHISDQLDTISTTLKDVSIKLSKMIKEMKEAVQVLTNIDSELSTAKIINAQSKIESWHLELTAAINRIVEDPAKTEEEAAAQLNILKKVANRFLSGGDKDVQVQMQAIYDGLYIDLTTNNRPAYQLLSPAGLTLVQETLTKGLALIGVACAFTEFDYGTFLRTWFQQMANLDYAYLEYGSQTDLTDGSVIRFVSEDLNNSEFTMLTIDNHLFLSPETTESDRNPIGLYYSHLKERKTEFEEICDVFYMNVSGRQIGDQPSVVRPLGVMPKSFKTNLANGNAPQTDPVKASYWLKEDIWRKVFDYLPNYELFPEKDPHSQGFEMYTWPHINQSGRKVLGLYKNISVPNNMVWLADPRRYDSQTIYFGSCDGNPIFLNKTAGESFYTYIFVGTAKKKLLKYIAPSVDYEMILGNVELIDFDETLTTLTHCLWEVEVIDEYGQFNISPVGGKKFRNQKICLQSINEGDEVAWNFQVPPNANLLTIEKASTDEQYLDNPFKMNPTYVTMKNPNRYTSGGPILTNLVFSQNPINKSELG